MPRTGRTSAPSRPGVIRRGAAGVSRWATGLASGSIVAGLGGAAAALEVIGPPPSVRIDSLWVHGHRDAVRVLVLCVLLMLLGVAATALMGRRRWIIGLAVIGLGWLVAWRHPESASVITRVLLAHWS
jgi:hypothetical protein